MSRTFAVSDLHGRYDLWEQIKEFLQEDDTLYVVGDCADRGKDGWKILQEVYADPRCIYLLEDYSRSICGSSVHIY